jgi:hypothetical protein
LKPTNSIRIIAIMFLSGLFFKSRSQQITGVWKGKINSTKIELKLVKIGDTLVGTSYYYDSKNNYRRYSIKGYFDNATNNVVWWDDLLIENKSSKSPYRPTSQVALLAVANFNCPGEGVMKLEGNSSSRDDKNIEKGPVNLLKAGLPVFSDEWDFVLENYTSGANDPYIIDSVNRLAAPLMASPDVYIETRPLAIRQTEPPAKLHETVIAESSPKGETKIAYPISVEEKYNTRTKMLQQVIPITGDSVELIFYDNAEIDGDSIALFLNGKKVFQHVMLTDHPYSVKFAVNDLKDDNECVMVAENLGTIPPNTALMIVMTGDKRYEAHLYSTENSSALIRFVKAAPKKAGT